MEHSARTKVLRLAVIVDDLVCDELHQSAPGSVTVGSSLRSNVVLYGARVPTHHRLFEARDGRYILHVPPHGAGKVSLAGRAVTLSALRRKAGSTSADVLHVKLPRDAKGKLLLGETTILFQLAEPKPVPRRVPFPVEFRRRYVQFFSREDAASLASAALVLGSYFTWAANAEFDDSFDADDIDERFAQVMGLRAPEPDREPEVEPEEEMLAQEEEKLEKREREPEKPEKVLKEKPEQFSEKALQKARGVGIARVLGTYSDSAHGAVFDVIAQTENNLGEMFAQGMTTTILADGGDISPFVAGGSGITAHGDTLESEGMAMADAPELEEGSQTKRERKVKAKLTAQSADVFGDVDKRAVQATIRRRISALQYCYERALRTQPDLTGKITYTISINVMGSVTKVAVEEDTIGNAAVRTCTVAKIKGWRFPMDGAQEPAEVTFPVVFSGGT